ncbi:KAP family NTPase [Burkholderia sp. AU30280]|uniref:P-loop NTPase fold protein n=1 Tax=Burkholderia sp. AU30280 TaxID=2879628 RepID=UPI001CF412B7|nr:P-loop NTPase fold protein [Burkholderia sp. AU30280]MCA8277341.1 KAP family NTPase [Burkholderia sp. AU30280]
MTFRPARLLPDEPAIADSFGAHDRIATALATLIESSDGGKSIRLDGEWGVGKSTVVQILRKRLSKGQAPEVEKNPLTRMFVYDAWVHSGDGLRRAFFESLVRDLRSCEWIHPESDADKKWTKKLLSMSGKRKLVIKSSWPELTQRARVAMALGVTGALFSPVVFSLLSKALQGLPASLLWGLTISGAAGLFYIVQRISASDLRVMTTRSTLDETTETLTDPEPTSIEFQEAFESLMTETLTSARKLVIVVDNLDRIDSDEAKQVWTLLRSFLDNPTFRKRDWFKRLWLLVPIADASRILGPTSVDIAAPVAGSMRGNILEKVFQVRMTLPLPMLRPWKEFLADKLEYCFGPDDDGSHEVIARLLHATNSLGSPTPREIVVLVNELVALHTERRGDMPLSTLAAYVLSRNMERHREWQVPLELAQVYYSTSMEQDFATLYLHAVKSEESLYLLILPSLERALEKGDSAELRDILDSSPAAQDVLEQRLIQIFSMMSQSPENANREQPLFFAYLRALVIFTDPTFLSPFKIGLLSHIRPRIDHVMATASLLNLSNPNAADGVAAYLKLTNNDAFSARRICHLLNSLVPLSESSESTPPAAWDVWVMSLIEILSIAEIRNSAIDFVGGRIRLRVSTERWASICMKIKAEPEYDFALDFLDTADSDNYLAEWIARELLPMNSDGRAQLVLQQGLESRGSGFFRTVTDILEKTTLARENLDAYEILECLTCVISASNDHARPFVRALAEADKFASWARNTQHGVVSFTVDAKLIKFGIIHIWSGCVLPSDSRDVVMTVFSSNIRQFFRERNPGLNHLTKSCSEIILRTGIYDVLSIIVGISDGQHEVLSQLLLELCADAHFRDVAAAELTSGLNGPASKLLVGQNAAVLRNLLVRAMEHTGQKASSPSA